MAGAISGRAGVPNAGRASDNFTRLMAHVAGLYCAAGSSSVSACEMHELAMSVAYALGIADATPEEAAIVLDVDDPIALWHEGVRALQKRTDAALALWRDVVATMPPIRNVALRDTLASLGELKRRYDVHFAALERICPDYRGLHVNLCDLLLPHESELGSSRARA